MMTQSGVLSTGKKILALYILLFSIAFADDNSSIWDITSKSLNSIWQKSKELGSDSWEETKKYTNMGKNILLEETLKTTMNMSLDINTTEVKEFKINEDDSIKMVVKLVGEKEDLILDIKNYDWGISKDKKYIVFENIQYSANIPWIKGMLKNHDNSFYFDYSKPIHKILLSIKSPLKGKK